MANSVFYPAAIAAVAKAIGAERLAGAMALVETSSLVLASVGALTAPAVYQSLGPRWLYLGLGVWFATVATITLATKTRWQPIFRAAPSTTGNRRASPAVP